MKGKIAILIAIVLICVAPMADTYILIPDMSGIVNALPNANPTLISFILTISSLFVIPSSLIAGKLVEQNKLSKKGALLIGFTLFTIGGAAGGLFANINWILFTRAIVGIGNGFATAMVASIVADYFFGQERASVMGLYNALGSLLAIGLTVLAGYLAVISWRLPFAVYLLCGLIVIYHAIILKKNPPKTAEMLAEEEEERKALLEANATVTGQKPRLGKAVWVLVVITILSQVVGNTLYLFLSIFIEGEGIGNAASTGMVNGVLTASIVVVSLVFGVIYNKFNKYTAMLFFLAFGIGYIMLSRSYSMSMVLISSIIWGIGFGLSVPYLYQEATIAPPKVLITFAGALINSTIFFSYVLSTFVYPLISGIFNNDSVRFMFNVLGIVMLVCAVLVAGYFRISNTKEQNSGVAL